MKLNSGYFGGVGRVDDLEDILWDILEEEFDV